MPYVEAFQLNQTTDARQWLRETESGELRLL